MCGGYGRAEVERSGRARGEMCRWLAWIDSCRVVNSTPYVSITYDHGCTTVQVSFYRTEAFTVGGSIWSASKPCKQEYTFCIT